MPVWKTESETSFFWMAESSEHMAVPMQSKRKVRPKKMEFVGWGSKPLIEFLKSNGKDSSKQLSQYDVAAIIKDYVNKNNLIHPGKKKRILCDGWLHSLFGKKSVPRIKIYDLLEAHFAENHDSSEDDLLYSLEGKEEHVMLTSKRRKISSSDKRTTHQKKQVTESLKSCFASIIPENIKLLYLKRSLLQDLLKDPESFESKVLGSYVRIKSDPNDYFQKNSHQLLPVTGIRKISESGDLDTDILLQVPNVTHDIPIHMLSDDDFSKEECEDLRQRVKDGVLKRPTVVELEQMARILHEDITKHWLPRELAFLQNLIDRSNEKGWRKELYEHLQRKQLLQTPSEQSRLLLDVPKVIADEVEPEATMQDPVENVKNENICSPTSILRGVSNGSSDSGANQTLSTHSPDAAGSRDAAIPPLVALHDSSIGEEGNRDFVNAITSIKESDGMQAAFETYKQDEKLEDQSTDFVQQQKGLCMMIRNESNGEMKLLNAGEKTKGSQGTADKQLSQVIELSDDEEEAEDLCGQARILDHPESTIWYYLDPQGVVQGPFSMTALKRWYDAYYFQPGFKVWKRGQLSGQAVLLTDVLLRMFPK